MRGNLRIYSWGKLIFNKNSWKMWRKLFSFGVAELRGNCYPKRMSRINHKVLDSTFQATYIWRKSFMVNFDSISLLSKSRTLIFMFSYVYQLRRRKPWKSQSPFDAYENVVLKWFTSKLIAGVCARNSWRFFLTPPTLRGNHSVGWSFKQRLRLDIFRKQEQTKFNHGIFNFSLCFYRDMLVDLDSG